MRSVRLSVLAIGVILLITGCGRSAGDASEPSPTPEGLLIEGQAPDISARIRFDSEDKVKTADYKVSIYPPMKLTSDDGAVTMPHGSLNPVRERDIQPKFLCRDFSAATDAIVPVIWERETGVNGAGELPAPYLDLSYSPIDRSDLSDYGMSDIQIVGLTGKCQSLKASNTMTFLSDFPATEHQTEGFESRLIVFKGYYGPAQPAGRPEVLNGLQMRVGTPTPKDWVVHISGSPTSSLRSWAEYGCKNSVIIPLTTNASATKTVTPFACPTINSDGT